MIQVFWRRFLVSYLYRKYRNLRLRICIISIGSGRLLTKNNLHVEIGNISMSNDETDSLAGAKKSFMDGQEGTRDMT